MSSDDPALDQVWGAAMLELGKAVIACADTAEIARLVEAEAAARRAAENQC